MEWRMQSQWEAKREFWSILFNTFNPSPVTRFLVNDFNNNLMQHPHCTPHLTIVKTSLVKRTLNICLIDHLDKLCIVEAMGIWYTNFHFLIFQPKNIFKILNTKFNQHSTKLTMNTSRWSFHMAIKCFDMVQIKINMKIKWFSTVCDFQTIEERKYQFPFQQLCPYST